MVVHTSEFQRVDFAKLADSVFDNAFSQAEKTAHFERALSDGRISSNHALARQFFVFWHRLSAEHQAADFFVIRNAFAFLVKKPSTIRESWLHEVLSVLRPKPTPKITPCKPKTIRRLKHRPAKPRSKSVKKISS